MKIGILTFHRSINYGAFMQCYALSHELKERYPNHDVEVVDFEYLHKHRAYRRKISKINPFGIEYSHMYARFQKDLEILPLSFETFITDDTKDLRDYIKRNYDIVIVGSDAIWADKGGCKEGNPYWLFGNHLQGVVKMSYAASAFSTKFDELTNEERDYYREHLSSFYYIGVRDYATRDFVKSLFTGTGKVDKVHLNHDPSFFLRPANNYSLLRKVLKRNFVFDSKPSISFMTRHLPYIMDIREKYHKQYNMLHVYTRNSIIADVKDMRCRFVSNLSPYEWYNLFSGMTVNISNYFHGACLGLVNHIPTILVDDSNFPYMSKYSQVMTDLGLNDRLFKKPDMNKDSFLETIQFCIDNKEQEAKRIELAIEKERKKSNSFFEALATLL